MASAEFWTVWASPLMALLVAILVILNDRCFRPAHHCFVLLTKRVKALGDQVEALIEQQQQQQQQYQPPPQNYPQHYPPPPQHQPLQQPQFYPAAEQHHQQQQYPPLHVLDPYGPQVRGPLSGPQPQQRQQKRGRGLGNNGMSAGGTGAIMQGSRFN